MMHNARVQRQHADALNCALYPSLPLQRVVMHKFVALARTAVTLRTSMRLLNALVVADPDESEGALFALGPIRRDDGCRHVPLTSIPGTERKLDSAPWR